MELFSIGSSLEIKLSEGETPIPRANKERYAFALADIIVCNGRCTHTISGLPLYRKHLNKIIEWIDKTLQHKFIGKHELKFASPRVATRLYSPLSFKVYGKADTENDYWKLVYKRAGSKNGSGEMHFSIILIKEDLQNLKSELQAEIDKIDWENAGKITHYILPNLIENGIPCYSAAGLKTVLNETCKDAVLKKVFIGLDSVEYISKQSINEYSFNYGNNTLCVFDKCVIKFSIAASGLFEYWILDKGATDNVIQTFDYLPDDLYEDSPNEYYVDATSLFSAEYEGKRITDIDVTSVDTYPFSCIAFDSEKMKNATELPEKVTWTLSNGNRLSVFGYDIEYFGMKII